MASFGFTINLVKALEDYVKLYCPAFYCTIPGPLFSPFDLRIFPVSCMLRVWIQVILHVPLHHMYTYFLGSSLHNNNILIYKTLFSWFSGFYGSPGSHGSSDSQLVLAYMTEINADISKPR